MGCKGKGNLLSRVSDRESPPCQPYYYYHCGPALCLSLLLPFHSLLTPTYYYFGTNLPGLSNPTLGADKRETLAILSRAIANFILCLYTDTHSAKMSSPANNDQKIGRSSPESAGLTEDETVAAIKNGTVVNASGYKDQLKRQYSLVGLAGIAVTVDNAWVALGSSISVSIGMFTALHQQSLHTVKDMFLSVPNSC